MNREATLRQCTKPKDMGDLAAAGSSRPVGAGGCPAETGAWRSFQVNVVALAPDQAHGDPVTAEVDIMQLVGSGAYHSNSQNRYAA